MQTAIDIDASQPVIIDFCTNAPCIKYRAISSLLPVRFGTCMQIDVTFWSHTLTLTQQPNDHLIEN